ncbi:hypothetical protein BLNAU_8479 [Blattamonas nauphoetae]|uniref:Uncharacterized protein n=1 Tax=Blattamonas nauphoetae TaxID=2049346 RepID=A0ABQ9XYV2_9EUKA|nr:hypothetical protein BLNAU_8479 [Blattamonas nauphoetae]
MEDRRSRTFVSKEDIVAYTGTRGRKIDKWTVCVEAFIQTHECVVNEFLSACSLTCGHQQAIFDNHIRSLNSVLKRDHTLQQSSSGWSSLLDRPVHHRRRLGKTPVSSE